MMLDHDSGEQTADSARSMSWRSCECDHGFSNAGFVRLLYRAMTQAFQQPGQEEIIGLLYNSSSGCESLIRLGKQGRVEK